MSILRQIMTDTVSLIKKNGQTIKGIKANVQSKTIFIEEVKNPIEEGDVITRTLPSGIVEKFEVLDTGYHAAFHGVPAHYQIKFQKEGRVSRPADKTSQITTYNLQGTHARVNIHSTDQSVNVSNTNINSMFADMRQAIIDNVGDDRDREALTAKVNELEQAAMTTSYTQKYQEFMALAANHMTILTPFMPALAQLLTP